MHSQELYKKKSYYSIYVHTNKWTAYSILDPITRKNKQKINKKGSLTPSQQPFKGKEAKQISILAMVNLFSGKYSEKTLCLEHESYMCDTTINTHQYKMKILAHFTFRTFTKVHTGKPQLRIQWWTKRVALMKKCSIKEENKRQHQIPSSRLTNNY